MKEREKAPSQLINEHIRYPRLQVITAEGQNLGVISRYDALAKSHEAGLDLVIISDQGAEGAPVAKIMDFGKSLYAKKKKQSAAKKHQKVIQVKEMKVRPKIGEHDLMTKLNQAIQFLQEGKRVKLTVELKGREMFLGQDRGKELFERIAATFAQAGIKNLVTEIEGRKDIKSGMHLTRLYYIKD